MAKRQGLDDIIRDAIDSTRPKRKTKPYKFNVGDVAYDPLSSIQRPRRKTRFTDEEIARFGGTKKNPYAPDLKNIPYNQRPPMPKSKAKKKRNP